MGRIILEPEQLRKSLRFRADGTHIPCRVSGAKRSRSAWPSTSIRSSNGRSKPLSELLPRIFLTFRFGHAWGCDPKALVRPGVCRPDSSRVGLLPPNLKFGLLASGSRAANIARRAKACVRRCDDSKARRDGWRLVGRNAQERLHDSLVSILHL